MNNKWEYNEYVFCITASRHKIFFRKKMEIIHEHQLHVPYVYFVADDINE